MNCPKCHREIPDSAIICRDCGSPISRSDDSSPADDFSTQKIPSNHQHPPPSQQPAQYQQHQQNQPYYNQPYHNNPHHHSGPPHYPPPQYPPNYNYPPPHQPNQTSNVTVNVPKNESVAFAVITLILFLFSPLGFVSYPFALILTIIGLFTGPKKGCFTSMFIVFVVIPGLIILVLLNTAAYILEDIADWVFGIF